ncbi:RAI1 like protein, partial [Ancylostoma duodenale]
LHEADFLCWRGLLTRIAATPFCPRDSWEFAAARIGDVIFLCERETEETRQRKLSMSQRDKMMTYWGFKFEQYMTVAEKDGLPKVDEVVTCREEFAVVVRSTLAATAGKPLKLVYSGEVDAINKGIKDFLRPFSVKVLVFHFSSSDGDLVELKTQRNALEGFFWKQKSLKWWLQSFLLGVRDIIVGYRDDDGFVKKVCKYNVPLWRSCLHQSNFKVGSMHTDDLCKRGEWSGNICMNLLSTVLTSV